MLFIHRNNIKISSHGLINNPIPMAHTQLYFYIIQPHVNTLNFHALTISFYTCPKPFILSNILLTTHMDHSRANKQIGTVFNSSQNEQWAVRGQPSHQVKWNQNPWPFPTQQHPNHNLTHNYNTREPFQARDQSGTIQNGFQKCQQFSPKFWDRPNGHSRPQTLQIIYKPLGVVETPQNRCPRVALVA